LVRIKYESNLYFGYRYMGKEKNDKVSIL